MKLVCRITVIIAVCASIVGTATADETYKFEQSNSTIGFRLHQFFAATKGKFTQFSGTIDLDRDHPENSLVAARIQVSSIDTGIAKRDNHLKSAEFFNVAKFPEITFKSRSVKRTGPQSGDILGDFTMHGVTKPITLHVQLAGPLSGETKQTRWKVTTEPLKRRDFGLMFGATTEAVSGIGQEVSVNIDIEAMRAN
jgi:polyisoprenoid-binding protein YceI